MIKKYTSEIEEAMSNLASALDGLAYLAVDPEKIPQKRPTSNRAHHQITLHAKKWGIGPKFVRKLLQTVDAYHLNDAMPYEKIRVDYEIMRSALANSENLRAYHGNLTRLNNAVHEHESKLAGRTATAA